MEVIKLVRPSGKYAGQVMAYKKEMEQNKDSFDGCGGLEEVRTFEEWVQFEPRLRAKYKDGYVPSELFLAVREMDDRVVGMIDFRHPLSDYLFQFGGHIGYSVRPTERRKGYATEMLRLILPVCREFGENRVLVTCSKTNEGSRKTILKNGGILENEVTEGSDSGERCIVQRYWITL